MTTFEKTIYDDFLNRKINSFAKLMMKCKLANYDITPSLATALIKYTCTSQDETCLKIVYCSIKNDLFSKALKSQQPLAAMLDFNIIENTHISQRIILHIAKYKPGLLIRFYIKNYQMFRRNYGKDFDEMLEWFEILIFTIANRLSKTNKEFKLKYGDKLYKMVKENETIHLCVN